MQRAIPKPDKQTARHNLCISVETGRLVDKRVSTRPEPTQIWRLGRAVSSSLKEYRQRQVMTTGEEAEILLTVYPPLPRKSWRRMRVWYIEVVGHAPPPARVTLEQIMAEREELY